MAYSPGNNQITLSGLVLKVIPGSYVRDDLDYFSNQVRSTRAQYRDYRPEEAYYWDRFHKGYGNLYYDPGTSSEQGYYSANGVDASVLQQVTLGPGFATTFLTGGATFSENVVDWKEFKGELYAVGSRGVYNWNPTASPNGWRVVATTNAGIGRCDTFTVNITASTSTVPGGAYLYVPVGTATQIFVSNASTTFVTATPASHFLTIRNELWKAYVNPSVAAPSWAQSTWLIAKSADGITYAGGNIFQVGDGVATVNNLVNYDNRLYIESTKGIQAFDFSGNGQFIDLIPELGQYGDPQLGAGAQSFHGVAFLPSNFGLLQFYGSNVVNPQIAQAMKSIGPDVQSWSQSDVRGKFFDLAPAVNYLYGTLNSVASNGYVMKYRDYPDLQPGDGWHPVMKFANQTVGGIKVSALPWYGSSYPILWVSAGNSIYQARLPSEDDNALLDTKVLYQQQGTLDLPIIDDNLPTVQKSWLRWVIDASVPTFNTLTLLNSFDGGAFATMAAISGTTGILEFDFPSNTAQSYKLQTRFLLSASVSGVTATQSPVIRSLALHHLLRPQPRHQWQLAVSLSDAVTQNTNKTVAGLVSTLDTDRATAGPVLFTDIFGSGQLVTVRKFTYKEVDRTTGGGPQLVGNLVLEDLGNQNGAWTQSAYTMQSFTS